MGCHWLRRVNHFSVRTSMCVGFLFASFHHIYYIPFEGNRRFSSHVCLLEIAHTSRCDEEINEKVSICARPTVYHFEPLEVPLVEQKSRLQDFCTECIECVFIEKNEATTTTTHFITGRFLCSGWLGYQDKST